MSMTQNQMVDLIIAILAALTAVGLTITITVRVVNRNKKSKFKQNVTQRSEGDSSPNINIGQNK